MKRIIQLLIVMSVFFWAVKLEAIPILDQYFEETHNLISGRLDKAQTFTVGVTGTLTEIDVYIARGAGVASDLLFDLRDTTIGGVPIESDTATLASITVPYATISESMEFFSIDISSFGVSVTEGDVLAIVLRSELDETWDYSWYGRTSTPLYAGGAHYFRQPPGWPRPTWYVGGGGDQDLMFKTFVEVVPEPATIALLGIGLVGLGGRYVRKRSRKKKNNQK